MRLKSGTLKHLLLVVPEQPAVCLTDGTLVLQSLLTLDLEYLYLPQRVIDLYIERVMCECLNGVLLAYKLVCRI